MNIRKVLDYYKLTLNDNNKILCPFHSESKPSLDINFQKELFYCFGCGAKGDIIELVAAIEKIDRLKALQKIVSITNGEYKKPLVIGKFSRRYTKQAYKEYQDYDKPNWRMPNYLTKRGFSPKMLCRAKIKVNPLSEYLYVIPLYENGKFKGYTKRTIDNRASKYIFNRGFRRQLVLIGRYEKGIIFVTEGILDYLKAKQYGAKNVICLLGWKASRQQIVKIKKYTSKVIAALDNDTKGKEGINYLKKYFKVIEFKYPSKIKDICEMSKKQFRKNYKEVLNA